MPLPLGPPDESCGCVPTRPLPRVWSLEPRASLRPAGQAVSRVGSAEGDRQALPVPVPKVPTVLR